MPEDKGGPPPGVADVSLNSKEFYALLLFVAVVGVAGALIFIVFFLVEDVLTGLLWEGISMNSLSPVFDLRILVLCILGGLLAGGIRSWLKGDIAIMAEDLIEFEKEGKFGLKRGLELFLRGLASLVCGAPLGPEAPLTVSTGAVGAVIAEKARLPGPVVPLSSISGITGFFGAFLSSPFAGSLIFIETTLEKGVMNWKVVLPTIVAATAGFAATFLLTGPLIGATFALPPPGGWRDIYLLYAILLGAIGGACGILFIGVYHRVRRIFEPLEHRPMLLGLIGGIGMGVTGLLLPLTLFMGNDQLQFLVEHYLEAGILLLAALVIGKILLMAFSFSTGFAGGYIFPSFFIGGTLGVLVCRLLPFMPLALCVVCIIAGVSVSLLRSPIALAFLIGVFFQSPFVPAMAVSLVIGFCVSYRFSLPYTRKGTGKPA
jgi:H+/Cl- antiporter ClcA